MSGFLFGLIRQSKQRNAANPSARKARLTLETLEDRLVPTVGSIIHLPPPPTFQDYFQISQVPATLSAGSFVGAVVQEMGPNGPVTSGAVSTALMTVNVGTQNMYQGNIALSNGWGVLDIQLNIPGTVTIKANYNANEVSGQELAGISGQISTVVTPAPVQTFSNPTWAGYTINTPKGTTAVGGTWVQSAASGPNGSTAWTWVGIDGWQGATVEQIGTAATVVNGQTQYNAWWEFYGDQSASGAKGPAFLSQALPKSFVVEPGDTISAEVSYLHSTSSTSTFLFQITDRPASGKAIEYWSSNETTTYVVPPRSTAEWIVENPNGGAQQLADFGSESFTGAWATSGSTTGAINAFNANNVTAVNLFSNSSVIEATVNTNPPSYSTSVGYNEPANGLGSSSFTVDWGLNIQPIRFYSAQISQATPSVNAAMAAQLLKGSVNSLQGDAGQATGYVGKNLVLATGEARKFDSGSTPLSLQVVSGQGGQTNSSKDSWWAELARRDDLGLLFSASHDESVN